MESIVSSDRKLANAVGAQSARACDNCIKKRFLCQSCDTSVHSANPLAALRQKRVRLRTSSIKSWHQGFTRKARAPRHRRSYTGSCSNRPVPKTDHNPAHLVPEICSEENSDDEDEEQLLYWVPIFDPLCISKEVGKNNIFRNEAEAKHGLIVHEETNHFLPTETDLSELAADVESLLGNGLENESFDMEVLGILDCVDEREKKWRANVEDDDQEVGEVIDHHHQGGDGEFIDIGRESFVLNFDWDSRIMGEEEDNKGHNIMVNNDKVCDSSKKIFLRLDYEGVISAWDDRKSPWTNGERPDLDPGECWPDCVGTCEKMHVYGEIGMMSTHAWKMDDGGREARVSRYKEKRRTRLFSKKIRYEVRKLNAEKRPRMKGRFVKRANFVNK